MPPLTYDDAWELSLLLRKQADDLERRAADFDAWQDAKANYTSATKAWAAHAQGKMRARANAFRDHARATLERASDDSRPSDQNGGR